MRVDAMVRLTVTVNPMPQLGYLFPHRDWEFRCQVDIGSLRHTANLAVAEYALADDFELAVESVVTDAMQAVVTAFTDHLKDQYTEAVLHGKVSKPRP